MASIKNIQTSFGRLAREPYGAKFYKVDFHFHTPGSQDARGRNRYGFNPYRAVKYPKNDHSWARTLEVRALQEGVLEQARSLARSMIDRFIEEGLAMVAITDHNGIATIWNDPNDPKGKSMDLAAPTWYELVSEEAELRNAELGKTAITILPGAEISTTGVHILAVFPPMAPKRKVHFSICDLLTEVGFGVDDFGKNPKVGHASVYHTLDLIHAKGGVPIIAHIDGSDQSLLKLYDIKSGSMKKVLSNPHLHALEMVDPARLSRPQKGLGTQSLGDWIATVRRKAELPGMAYFQGSDAHDMRAVGKRFSYVKMTSPSFEGLRGAIQSPSSRIRVGDLHQPPEEGLYVYGVEVNSKFFGTRRIHFNRHLNCMVGRQECGKSLLLQLMHKAVDEAVNPDGKVKLYIERRSSGRRSEFFCFTRRRDAIQLFARVADGGEAGAGAGADKWEELPLDHPEHVTLRPKFYNPDRMEQLMDSPEALQAFLIGRLGKPTARRVAKLNETLTIPSFLAAESSPLVELSLTKAGAYALALNTKWRRGRPKFLPFARLSKSQRRFVVIAIVLLSARPGPLIVDAPGGHFDNQDIAEYLVPLIKYIKNFRQIIVATNNSNLTVNSDPENYIVLEASHGKLKKMQAGFAIDNQEQRDALVKIMEGTLASFRRRSRRYGAVRGQD